MSEQGEVFEDEEHDARSLEVRVAALRDGDTKRLALELLGIVQATELRAEHAERRALTAEAWRAGVEGAWRNMGSD